MELDPFLRTTLALDPALTLSRSLHLYISFTCYTRQHYLLEHRNYVRVLVSFGIIERCTPTLCWRLDGTGMTGAATIRPRHLNPASTAVNTRMLLNLC